MSIVPDEIEHAEERVRVGRAWPRGATETTLRLRVEGRDDHGRLRAGELALCREPAEGGRWRVERTRLTPFAVDDRLPGLEAVDGDLVVHRVGRRAVLRRRRDYVKVVRPERVDDLVRSHESGRLLVGRAGWAAPTAHRIPDVPGAVSLGVVPGVPLHELAAGADPRVLRRAWRTFAAGWSEITRPVALDLPTHDARAEADLTSEAVDRALLAWAPPPATRRRILDQLAGVRRALLDDAGHARTPSHRDLHDKQLLVGETLGLLDLDTAALAEPELDLANLHEHVLLRGRQGLWPDEAVAAGVDGVAAAADAVGADPRRLEAYRAATRLRIGAIYLFRPRWSRPAQEWLATGVDENALIGSSLPGHAPLGALRA